MPTILRTELAEATMYTWNNKVDSSTAEQVQVNTC